MKPPHISGGAESKLKAKSKIANLRHYLQTIADNPNNSSSSLAKKLLLDFSKQFGGHS
jgi:hypothetical protein